MENPHRALWRAVLNRVVQDALSPTVNNNPTVSSVPKPEEREYARRFLTRPSKDLNMLCELSAVEMNYVIRKTREALEKEKHEHL